MRINNGPYGAFVRVPESRPNAPLPPPEASGEDVTPAPTFRRRLYDLLEANNKPGMLLEALTVLLIVVNVVCFMLSTERSLADNTTAWLVFDSVELCTVSRHCFSAQTESLGPPDEFGPNKYHNPQVVTPSHPIQENLTLLKHLNTRRTLAASGKLAALTNKVAPSLLSPLTGGCAFWRPRSAPPRYAEGAKSQTACNTRARVRITWDFLRHFDSPCSSVS